MRLSMVVRSATFVDRDAAPVKCRRCKGPTDPHVRVTGRAAGIEVFAIACSHCAVEYARGEPVIGAALLAGQSSGAGA